MRNDLQRHVQGHQYRVVKNQEGQYALWSFKLAPPAGWITIHSSNSQEECLEFIDSNWTNIMPNCLQNQVITCRKRIASGAIS
ncbi:MAG: MbtH family NRPS accessory protein [Cyanobacteria bacterium K_Offshore_surface_m2_239]|nr:MbtH family NRPS accessory protein [Cyanobacteria bacterium K_Offshore_surface_m2_239]